MSTSSDPFILPIAATQPILDRTHPFIVSFDNAGKQWAGSDTLEGALAEARKNPFCMTVVETVTGKVFLTDGTLIDEAGEFFEACRRDLAAQAKNTEIAALRSLLKARPELFRPEVTDEALTAAIDLTPPAPMMRTVTVKADQMEAWLRVTREEFKKLTSQPDESASVIDVLDR